MDWTFVYLMFGLKLPIAALLWLVWWAVHQTPEIEGTDDDDGGDGGARRPRHPRPTRPRRPRTRGPHGQPVPPAPARTRTVVARARDSAGR